MSTSRTESQPPLFGRRRSNTVQSIQRSPPLKVGDTITLNSWVHDPKESTSIIFNHSWWPGVVEGDMLSVQGPGSEAFLFIVGKEESATKPQLQISIPKAIADAFGLRNNGEVTLKKVAKEVFSADYLEFVFQDQYLGRNDMWRLGEHLVGQCVHVGQDISFIGSIAAKIQTIYVGGLPVPSACVTARTKAIYRSLSARITIFIQVCRELWEFAGDGERYNEKIVHSFLPALFNRWREAGTNHTVTIVLISRVYYDDNEVEYAAGPLRRDEFGEWYKDFFKVITDLEVIYDWKPTLVNLKNSFWDFQRDILLTHHYHRASLDGTSRHNDLVRLVGRLSYAHDSPILEALNLALNPTETHYIDRSLTLTGVATILISPGSGYYRVSKQLLRLTTTRMLDQGFGLDLICLGKPPLHQSPIFSFQGIEPQLREDKDLPIGSRATDPLWGGDEDSSNPSDKKTFWWEPFWISVSFWDRHMDLPLRQDRFIARAKMHEIQMLGLLEHDVLSSIELPFLQENVEHDSTPVNDGDDETVISQQKADKFDNDIFAPAPVNKYHSSSRNSLSSLGVPIIPTVVPKVNTERRNSHRNSLATPKIPPIAESPRRIIKELPPEGTSDIAFGVMSRRHLSSSPSQSSITSAISTPPAFAPQSNTRSTFTSRLNPSWLLRSFRNVSNEDHAETPMSLAGPTKRLTVTGTLSSPIQMPPARPTVAPTTHSALPITIHSPSSTTSALPPPYEEYPMHQSRSPLLQRSSPISISPRDDQISSRRRNTLTAALNLPLPSSLPAPRCNPSQPRYSLSAAQSPLAARWQHIFPRPLYKSDIKWKSLVTPGCLPLTVENIPSMSEIKSSYDVFIYEFVVDPTDMRSFLVKPPSIKGTIEERRRAWALVVMRGMAAVRLAQGFQFVLRSSRVLDDSGDDIRTSKMFVDDDEINPRALGASEVLQCIDDPVYLSMTNEIHRIAYTGDSIQVCRYVRRMPHAPSFDYQCLIWPKLGVGYTEQTTTFTSHGPENYGWNRLDMLVAGYEQQFNESLRYWRTRFLVIPTLEPPEVNVGPLGEQLNEEEARLIGIEKLAEQFTKLRWQPAEEKFMGSANPVRFLPTTLNPAVSVLDEQLMDQLDQIHAVGPLRKKIKSERDIGDMPLMAVSKAMREENGVPIKYNHWHRSQYPDSFTGFDFVSWLVREFRDVGSRAQATEWGIKFLEAGLFEHVRGHHGFLDGHYFYRLKGEYAVASTPRAWFRSREEYVPKGGYYPSSIARQKVDGPRRNKRRLILSQTTVIDIDTAKKSDQAESVILHHDIIHNPSTVFHFELQWIGTTARCIEDQLRQWNKAIERYGLKLVETYVTQIFDIRDRNAFQSCFPLKLAVPPPIVPNLPNLVPEGTQTAHYFEYALLRRFGFILDIEAADLYPSHVDVVYSYRRSPFRYSQFVHRSGVAFVQVLGGSQGLVFLTNRLMGPGRMGTTLKNKEHRPAREAEAIRLELQSFCSDPTALNNFYDEEIALLGHGPEEPPPLSI